MKKVLLISLSCILLLCGCSSNQKTKFSSSNNEQLENEIKENFSKISEVADLSSSNPYDYTNNEYYENIVNLGIDAVFILMDMYNSGKLVGVDAYLSTLAIQDITKCNLYKEYNLEWETAEEFYELWEKNNCDFNK